MISGQPESQKWNSVTGYRGGWESPGRGQTTSRPRRQNGSMDGDIDRDDCIAVTIDCSWNTALVRRSAAHKCAVRSKIGLRCRKQGHGLAPRKRANDQSAQGR